jgi:flagellar protein FlgJ
MVTKFKNSLLPLAQVAGAKYGLNPLFILSVAAFESGWGQSKLAKTANNYFGIIATKKTNNYWFGSTQNASTGLTFRKYTNAQNSFFDFARLIKTNYQDAAAAATIQDFALRMSESRYISTANGDNRLNYRKGLVKCYGLITNTPTSLVSDDTYITLLPLIILGFYAYRRQII